ncbi:MAG: tRNA (adenosine(37)-N6)-threonylcarbamoyltransferase complex dimerization subunit type 1 TsaB [Myxococcota bacterium]
MARLLLAIECASRRASAALAREGEGVVAVREADPALPHAASLLPAVDALLAGTGVHLDDLDAFAVAVGPGAFTSLRIGIATVKGLAFAAPGVAPVVAPVSTLGAIALETFEGASTEASVDERPVAAVLDARRGEVYAGVFERPLPPAGTADRLAPASPGERVEAVAALARALPPRARLAGEPPRALLDALRDAGRDDVELAPPPARPRAAAVAALGRAQLASGRVVEAAALAPRYLRRPEAEEKRLRAERAG